MKVHHRLPTAKRRGRGLSLAIGVFDGLHLGHLAVLSEALALARRHRLEPALLTFDTLPEAALGREAPALVQHPDERLEQLAALGFRQAWVVPFTRRFSRLEPAAFVQGALQRRLGARALSVGHDFRFGRGAQGGVEELRELALREGMALAVAKPLKAAGRPVSSTWVREAVAAGRMAEAARLLGRPWRLRGKVGRGQGLGAKIGFPTANLATPQGLLPRPGVWAGRCRIVAARRGPWRPFVANLGTRPTVGGRGLSIELHLPGFHGSLRGRTLEAEFIRFLREERRFKGLEALKAQIGKDLARAARLRRR